MLRKALTVSGAGLGLFHLWLFAGQAWDGRLIADPGLLIRWLLAAGLVVALAGLRRRGVSLFGRRAVAVWLVALLLHAPSIAGPSDAIDARAVPEATETLARVAMASIIGLGLSLLLAPGAAAPRPFALHWSDAGRPSGPSAGTPASAVWLLRGPRPPPRA